MTAQQRPRLLRGAIVQVLGCDPPHPVATEAALGQIFWSVVLCQWLIAIDKKPTGMNLYVAIKASLRAKHLPEGYSDSISQLFHVVDANVPFTSFNLADVGSMEASPLRKNLLE